ncbi:cyclic lactone autoinducer peptide [Roseburia sp. TF10-5]|uniref:cyclic lactone autoinducer peptide n=1 Tax=Roseburia sp. TF10-5 TaxID=2293144 RepID=UPI001FA90E26|nr:cyclic lactone autoinducer peptide [Roseburia sp. TF10-5]
MSNSMKKVNRKPMLANALTGVATAMLSSAANTRCAFVYHQPKQPTDLKKFRKF